MCSEQILSEDDKKRIAKFLQFKCDEFVEMSKSSSKETMISFYKQFIEDIKEFPMATALILGDYRLSPETRQELDKQLYVRSLAELEKLKAKPYSYQGSYTYNERVRALKLKIERYEELHQI